MSKVICKLTLLVLLMMGAHLAQAQDDLGCSSYVTLNGGTIEVESIESQQSSDDLSLIHI